MFQYRLEEVTEVGVVKFGSFSLDPYNGTNNIGFYVEWNPRTLWSQYYRIDLGFWMIQRKIEFIGNIHDNPELMEGGRSDGQ